MPPDRESRRIVIAGASSLLGAELKSLFEESRFAAADFRLVDEELAAGTLTEAGGEAAVIQAVEEGSFDRARFVFFTGSAEFTRANIAAARRARAKVIDLSGAIVGDTGTVAWFPGLERLRGHAPAKDAIAHAIPSAPATAAAMLSLGLAAVGTRHLVFIGFQPVSEAGRAGIEELEGQTTQLLSFQNIGKPVFDTQVAFTLLDRFGSASSRKLTTVRERLRTETRALLGTTAPRPALQLVHAPVFYGTTFTAWAEIDSGKSAQEILHACKHAGFRITDESEGPSNVTAAGESVIQLAVPETDPAQPGTWWFWGAADNVRLPAANAVKLADTLSA